MLGKKILYIAPHLSTGGLPQFLCKKIELLSDTYEIYVVEYSDITGGVFVVQRNKIKRLIPKERFFTLGENKKRILTIIEELNPDYIHLEEIPEYFMDPSIARLIYNDLRKYKIFETSHDSSINIDNKHFLPDKFLLISEYQASLFKPLGVELDIVEYPIEYKTKGDRNEILKKLGLDPEYKHVINVGLWTSRKNQAEIIDYARDLEDYKIKFHFIGNMADNFKDYWGPLVSDLPSNCTVWGERDDVDNFYGFADLFLFTSRGHENDKETSPLVIREAIGFNVPSLIYNLPVYLGMYDQYSNIRYLSDYGDNTNKILESLDIIPKESSNSNSKKITIIDVYAATEERRDFLRKCIKSVKKLDCHIMVVSHCSLPVDIIESVDYYLFDKDNSFNSNNVFSYRGDKNYVINQNITESHEFAIIRSLRLAFNAAKNLGYDSFYFTEFDHEYSSEGIRQIKSIESDMIERGKKLLLFHPPEAMFGNIKGKYYESSFFLGSVNYFLEEFDPFFPKTIEEYNDQFTTRFPNCLEHFFYNIFYGKSCHIIESFVKGYFIKSPINLSSYRDTVIEILPDSISSNHYLVINANNLSFYNYSIYFNEVLKYSFKMGNEFKVFDLKEDSLIKIEISNDTALMSTKILDYKKSKYEDYKKSGNVQVLIKPDSSLENSIKVKLPIKESFSKTDNKITFSFLEDTKEPYLVSIKDIDSLTCIYSANIGPGQKNTEWWVVPLPVNIIDFNSDKTFGGFLLEYRDSRKNLLEKKELRIKNINIIKPVMDISNFEPIFMNYHEFFIDKVYDNYKIKNQKTVLDIGASIGLWTNFILLNGAEKVYSFEPNKKALNDLRNNFKDHSNVHIFDKAIYKENSTLKFYTDETNTIVSSLFAIPGNDYSYDVDAITLEDAIDLTGESVIDLVKIDTEGAEFGIIEKTHKKTFDRINSFLIEYHDFYFDDGVELVDKLIQKLNKMGYKTIKSDKKDGIAPQKIIFATK